MIKHIVFIFLNLITSIKTDGNAQSPYPDGNDDNGPGVSSCRYLGDYGAGECKIFPMNVKMLPPECTAYFFDGIKINQTGNEQSIHFIYNYDNWDSLKDISKSGKKVYVYFIHSSIKDWTNAFEPEKTKSEVQTLQEQFFGKYKIKGLVLSNIVKNDIEIPRDFSCNLIKYINALKESVQGLQIGLRMSAASIQTRFDKKSNNWLDFPALNKVLDFYSIEFSDFNKCSSEYISTGIIPMDGPGNNLKKFSEALKALGLPKDKIYFEFLISPSYPQSAGFPNNPHGPCFIRYTKICEHKEEGIEFWCADTTHTLRGKGAFAKENGAGFIAFSIDASDRNKKCDCYDSKYPTFFFMLDGYYNVRKDKVCKKIDRIFD